MHSANRPPPRLYVLLLAALAWLVMMGPFLHMHIGQASTTGFHVDGMTASALSPSAMDSTGAKLSGATPSDSPALGIAASLPRKASTTLQLDPYPFFLANPGIFVSPRSLDAGRLMPSAPGSFTSLFDLRDLTRHSLARLLHAPPHRTKR